VTHRGRRTPEAGVERVTLSVATKPEVDTLHKLDELATLVDVYR
jgi:hypothetical protein